MTEEFITVPQVFDRLGYEPVAPDTWTAGALVREAWLDMMGHYPIKQLRPKTNGGGSHCFAIYPIDWLPKIESIVRSVAQHQKRQGSLF
jgi:hypothetical protein